jgi:acid phosphatase (class A)
MTHNRPALTRMPAKTLYSVLLALCLLPAIAAPPSADSYLAPGRPDGVALLPPPPGPGSAEETADLATARAIFHGRTPADEKRAVRNSSLSFSLFAPAIGPAFEPAKLPKIDALLRKVKNEIGDIIDIPKDHWKRRRPYQLDSTLSLGQPEQSSSYPSGHSTRGTVYSLLLAEIFPEKRDAILAIGCDIGWDRIVIGKHFPTDVYAGRVLGKAIVRELLESPVFQHDLAEARAEAAALAKPEVQAVEK